MPATKRISTIIATCNRPGLLMEALDSVAAQRLQPMEVIVVDDGSGIETRRAVEQWRMRHVHAGLKLRYFYQNNRGPAAARNRGFAESRGDGIQFMDDDDLMEPDALQHLSAALDGAEGPALSMASYALLHQIDTGLLACGAPQTPPDHQPGQRLAAMIAGRWFVPIHGYLFTRDALNRIGPWHTQLSSQEDDEFLLRAALRGVDFVPAPHALVYYRQHNGVRRANPGKPGESLMQGLRNRLFDDISIRRQVARELRTQGILEHYRAAFRAWRRRLAVRYGKLLNELEEDISTLGEPHREPIRKVQARIDTESSRIKNASGTFWRPRGDDRPRRPGRERL